MASLAYSASRGALALAFAVSAACSARAASAPLRAAPSQFEVAMLQTLEGVRRGTLPDPAARKPDGSPGTLLDALLPKTRNSVSRRKLSNADDDNESDGARIPFAVGPTLSSFNASSFRYASVTPPPAVDWRNTAFLTPIQMQLTCASCWVNAPADAVVIANAIARAAAPIPASTQQVCDCGVGPCCNGGWPERAFTFMVQQTNVTTAASYPYVGVDGRTCNLTRNYPVAGNISGFERVPPLSQISLMRAVSMQPVVVFISVASRDFLAYDSTPPGTPGFTVYDGNCTTDINHVLLAVGYNTSAPTPYWVLKNSWPLTWGDNGYMYIAMQDGPGKCGMLSIAPLFPVNFPTAPSPLTWSSDSSELVLRNGDFWWQWWQPTQGSDPCAGIINPCGGGTCLNGSTIARCSCPAPFVELRGVPTSRCVHPSPCTSGQFNPCGSGTCLDVGDGGYICGCPTGFAIGAQVSGNPTCVPVGRLAQRSIYFTQIGDSCSSLMNALGINSNSFRQLNPHIKCSSSRLAPGIAVFTNSPSNLCTQLYAVRSGDTCRQISKAMQMNFQPRLAPLYYGFNITATNGTVAPPTLNATVPTLATITNIPPSDTSDDQAINDNVPRRLARVNPTLSCARLYPSQLICVSPALSPPKPRDVDLTAGRCGATYTTARGDTCAAVQTGFGLNSTTFRLLNPALYCSFNGGFLTAGMQICVAPATTAIINSIVCNSYITAQQGDSCEQIWNAANLTRTQFFYLNPGIQCQAPFLFVGQQMCINSDTVSSINDPTFELYTVQPGDTLASIQSIYSPRCTIGSITIARIAAYNRISDWSTWGFNNSNVNTTLLIPCIPKIGAGLCDQICAPSLVVCGADFVNYPSYCHAVCAYAAPPSGAACTNCESACAGRYGSAPSTPSACPPGYICPFPNWPPALEDASKYYTCPGCRCTYRNSTCQQACAAAGGVQSSCNNVCMANWRVPCGGPSQSGISTGTYPCTTCGSTTAFPCSVWGKGTCATTGAYWSNWWTTNGPLGFNP